MPSLSYNKPYSQGEVIIMNHPQYKPHGTFQPQSDKGIYLLREPKGIPDVLLFSKKEIQTLLFSAADILSVQGITARIVIIENTERYFAQSKEYQDSVFSDETIVRVGVLHPDSAKQLSDLRLTCLSEDASAAELAAAAVRLLKFNNV